MPEQAEEPGGTSGSDGRAAAIIRKLHINMRRLHPQTKYLKKCSTLACRLGKCNGDRPPIHFRVYMLERSAQALDIHALYGYWATVYLYLYRHYRYK